MKTRILSLILALVMIVSVIIIPTSASFSPTADKIPTIKRGSDVIARFVVGSDIHVPYTDSVDKLRNAYAAMKKIGGVDAFIAAGDLTEGGLPDELALFQSIVAENSRELTIEVDGFTGKGAGNGAAVGTTIAMLGNHENYNANIEVDFREQVGQETDMIYWLNGKVPIIKCSMAKAVTDTWPSSFETKHDFIESAVKEVVATGYKGHIFLISHIAFGDTVFGSEAKGHDRYLAKTREFLSQYPQIVHISGHSHATPMNPGVIDQSAGFTSIVTGTVGKWFRQSEDTLYGSSFTVFDVKKDGTTELYRVNLFTGEIMYADEKWILDSSDKPEDFIYFNDPANAKNKNAYALKGTAPTYGAGVTVTAKDLGNHDSVEVTFTANAKPASGKNYDYVEGYTVKAAPVGGGDVIKTTMYNDPSFAGNETLTATIYGLEYDTDYEISVVAETAFGKESAPVKAKEVINVGNRGDALPLKTLYCVDYSLGDTAELKGHGGKIASTIKIVDDSVIGKKAANFRGFGINTYDFVNADIEKLRYGFTLEAYFMLTDNVPYQQIVHAVDAGIYFQVENGYISGGIHANSAESSAVCEIPAATGEWIHLVLTYDGKKAVLYKNGELAASQALGGGLSDIPEGEIGTITVGGYETNNDNLAKDSRLNMFSLSQGTMTADEVKAAYERTTAKGKDFTFTDVNDSDWFYPTVQYAYQSGLMNGTSQSLFAPATKTSRAMIVQMLYNMEGKPAVDKSNNPFADVASGAWYADAVLWAYQNGVTTGSSATTFSPDALVTREQVAVFLYRFMKDYKGEEMSAGAELSAFPDADKISPYAGFAEAVSWANGAGIVTGKGSGDNVLLAPLDQAQRSETATMFARFHKLFVR